MEKSSNKVPSGSEYEYDMSVIVPSYNSGKSILRCLEAIRGQDTTRSFEIIVSDSGSDGTAQMLMQMNDIAVIHSEDRLFPGTARNKGAEKASGKILCFTDSDCIPASDWLSKIWKTAPHKRGIAIGGNIENGTPENPVGTAEYLSELSGFLKKAVRRPVDFLPSANLSVGTGDFRKAGGFRDYEKGSDVTLGMDLRAIGVQPVYEPDICVAHLNRTDPTAFLKNQHRLGWGAGNNRILHDLPYSWIARFPPGWIAIPIARFSLIMYRSLRFLSQQRIQLLKAAPCIFFGAIAFGAGFASGVRDALKESFEWNEK